jgi:uncharacterized protein
VPGGFDTGEDGPYYTRPMSRAPADLVNAVELAGRAARLERRLVLAQLPRIAGAGALEGTHVTMQLEFGHFEGRVTVAVKVHGELVLTCQRCLRPCVHALEESATLAVVERDTDEVPGGYEPLLGNPEKLSLTGVIEEQVLLGMPLVPMHEDAASCGAAAAALENAAEITATDEKQRPFANLRQLLDEGTS